MKMYFLLRENKETGPYSLDELKSQKLRQLDLIWTEGESIIWKYPSEIKEFQSYVPAVKESLGTLVNNRKERQIVYFRWNMSEMGFKSTNINNIILPDAFTSDVPEGYEYLVMADGYRHAVDHSVSEQILEDVFAQQEEEMVVETKVYTVLGAPQVIDTAEVAATLCENTIELPFRYTSKTSGKEVRKKRKHRGLGHGLAGWAGLIAAAFMHFK